MRCRILWILVLITNLLCVELPARDYETGAAGKLQSMAELKEDTAQIHQLIVNARRLENKATDSAIALLRQAWTKSRAIMYTDGMADALLTMAACYHEKGQYKTAILLFNKSPYLLEHLIFRKKEHLQLRYYTGMAATHLYSGKMDTSCLFFIKALQLAQQIKDTSSLIFIHTNFGGFWQASRQPEKAIEQLLQAEQLSIASGNFKELHRIYGNMAAIYGDLGKADLQYAYAVKTSEWSKINGNIKSQRIALFHLSNYYLKLKPDSAIYFAEKAQELKDHDNPFYRLYIYRLLSGAYYHRKNYTEALKYARLALDISRQSDQRDYSTANMYANIADIYDQSGNPHEAFKYQKAYSSLNDSLMSSDRATVVNQLEIKYRSSEKDKTIAQNRLLLNRREQQLKEKNFWIGGISIGVLLMAVALLAVYRSNLHKQHLQEATIHGLLQEQELAKLRAQMLGEEQERYRLGRDLHDGIMIQFSAVKMNLSTLINRHKNMEGIKDFEATVDQLDEATQELRQTAHNLMPGTLLEEGLAEASFFFVKALQQRTNFNIHFQTYGALPRLQPDVELSIYRIIQELVHNIMKHAQATQALVQVACQEKLLMVSVEDDGVGFPESILTSKKGMGLNTIRTRVAAMNGSLELRSAEQKGTTVHMEFDISQFIKENNTEA